MSDIRPRLAMWAGLEEKRLLLGESPAIGRIARFSQWVRTYMIGINPHIGPRWLARADTLVMGSNPLLLVLAALAEIRAGRRVILAPYPGDDLWAYDLARRPAFLAFIARAAGFDAGPIIRPQWSADALGMTDGAQHDLAALADKMARQLPTDRLCRLPMGWSLALGRHDGTRALIHVERQTADEDGRDPERAVWLRAMAAVLRPLPRMAKLPSEDSLGLLIDRIMIVSAVPGMAPIMEADAMGGYAGRHDHPHVQLFGSARRLPASGPALLEAAVADVMAILAPDRQAKSEQK